jgi:hypothetical protein
MPRHTVRRKATVARWMVGQIRSAMTEVTGVRN